jgi:hypothetical protein
MIFHGRDGISPRDLWKQGHQLRGSVAPTFYSRAGEVLKLPEAFGPAIRNITVCVCCIGCKHSHVGVPPGAAGERESMTSIERNPIIVGEPNWHPLEMVLTPGDCENFMYMGRAGEIELYKHRFTRRYLNISQDGRKFYRYIDGKYVEISRSDALSFVRT